MPMSPASLTVHVSHMQTACLNMYYVVLFPVTISCETEMQRNESKIFLHSTDWPY